MKNKATSKTIKSKVSAIFSSIIFGVLIFGSILMLMHSRATNIVFANNDDTQVHLDDVDLMPEDSLKSLSIETQPLTDLSGTSFPTENPVILSAGQSVDSDLNQTALMFVENVGQFDDQVRFQLNGNEGTLFFTDDALWLTIYSPVDIGASGQCQQLQAVEVNGNCTYDEVTRNGVNIKLSFANANSNVQMVGLDPLPTRISYFYGNNPDKWHSNVPVYSGIRYEEIYPGIDIEFVNDNGHWQSLVKAAPWADLSQVVLDIEGADSQTLFNDTVQLDTSVGAVELPLFTVVDAKSTSLPKPSQHQNTILAPFVNPAARPQAQTSGDDDLIYSARIGGTEQDYSFSIAVDDEGAAYVSGITLSPDFPSTPGAFDESWGGTWWDNVVMKINPEGNGLIYATYLGRNTNSTTFAAHTNAIAVDDTGSVYVTGRTDSSEFPTTSGVYQTTLAGNYDIFLAKLNPDGSSLTYSTFIGGTDYENADAITVNSNGEVFITGYTDSLNFPTTSGAAQTSLGGYGDAFVTKVNASATQLIFSTYLGGSFNDNPGGSGGIAVDTAGSIYVHGHTRSTDFPTTSGAYQTTYGGGYSDAFVAKLSDDGTSLIYSTFLGGSGGETDLGGGGIAVDAAGFVYIVGDTESINFPTTTGAYQTSINGSYDIFVSKLNQDGSGLVYSTLIGGSDYDGMQNGGGIAINQGKAYLTGFTSSYLDFPVTIDALRTAPNDDWEGFVTKLSIDGSSLEYSTFLGGSDSDNESGGGGIAVDSTGAYVTGDTYSTDFPSTFALTPTTWSDNDFFIVKLDISDPNPLMPPIRIPITQGSDDAGHHCTRGSEAIDWNEVSLGHCEDESEAIGGFRFAQVDIPEDVAVDIYIEFSVESAISNRIAPISIYGEAVVDSPTFSVNDLPSDRFAQSTLTDEIVTWQVGDWQHLPIDPEFCCSITHVRTPSLNPIIAEMIAEGWVNGGALTFLTRPGEDPLHPFPPIGEAYANSRRVIAYDRGAIDTPGAQPTLVIQPLPPLPDGMARSAGAECPLCGASGATGWVGGPINTENGNLSYQQTDLSIPLSGGNLEFRRTYASDAVGLYTSTLGFGWTHNFDMRLNLTGFPDSVELQAPGGSSLPFFRTGDNTYTPYPGISAELVYDGNDFTVTAFDQNVYLFDSDGNLYNQIDPSGNVITFVHNTNNQLTIAGEGSRYFIYAYDELDRLTSVTDSLDREITLEYDNNGDLITVTNALELPTTYTYSGTTHLLTKVTDPSGTVVEETAYDNEGRAYQQWDGEGNLLVDIDYSLEDTRVVTENGIVMTYTYHPLRGTLLGVTYACEDDVAGCQTGSFADLDYNFNPRFVEDASGNSTIIAWDEGGSNLEYVQDAMGHETFLTYDQYNNLSQTVDARDNATRYFYDNPSFPTFLTRMTDALDKSTYFTPTTSAEGVPGLLKQQEDPDGRITTYTYNGFGQITEMVVAAGTSDAVTTAYGYDAVGRLITTTQSSASESYTSLNVYDNGDRLIATIGNWTGSNQANWAADCDNSSGARDTNICTLYDYDDAGRIISTTNTLGQTNLTFYDDAGRTFLSVTNWDGSSYNANNPLPDLCNFSNPDPEFNLCYQTEYDTFGRAFRTTDSIGRQSVTEYDSLGRVNRSVTNWQDGIFNANDPDSDIETLYEYDANGNVLVVTDTVGRMTRTFYDALNRVEGSITNWDGSTVLDDCSSLPTMRDSNICTQYEYDEVGNTIIVTDTLGRMSRTFYDDLNRVEATVLNWQPSLNSPDNCVLSATNNALENICTLYGYDDTGNQITTTNALNQTSLTVYDSANRPFLTVQNWDGTPISSENDCSFPPAESDINVCFVTYFDELGRRSGSKDALGNLTDFEYDGLGRIITTTRYLDNGGTPVETSIEYDALGNRLTQTDAEGNNISFLFDELNRMETSTTEEGVTQTNYYNAAGWVTQTVDTLLHPATFTYDDLGRRLTVTDAETNVTEYEYDALGNQTAMIDAELVRTTYEYDDLNRLERVIENDVPGSNPTNETDVVTEYSYDALGNRVHITNALGITNTHTTYDVLNRPWIVEDALGNQTETLYNALGYRVVMTDGNEAVTTYGYDGLNRLETVNYLADGIVVTYEYDALGNRKVMTDDLGTTSYDYDDLYRLTEVIDPFNATVKYGYDKVGNRTSLTYPDSRVVTYTYDFDNRLETVLDWNTGTTTYEYDLAGRLITTTLPSGVVSVNTFDDANRLTNLSHTSSNDVLIANFAYELDEVGNRITATETIRQPGTLAGVTAFLEENGQLVLEAESGTATAGTSHTWNSQTVQGDYAGTAYLRALPDIGQQYDATATADSPGLNFTVQVDNPGSYTVWARGMAPDAAGDSLHVGVNDGTPTTAANLTGFTPNEWSWSRLTMSNTNATVDLSSSGTYTLNVWMREDGLRLDKLMLVTDTATIPTGQGPLESGTTTALPPLGSHTIVYDYDDLYRLTDATYSGDITATYSYVYDAVGNMEAYTETIGSETSSVNRQFDDANQLLVSIDTELGTTSFYYDGNGNLDQILPPGVSPGGAGEQLYSFDQRNLITQYRVGVGGSVYDTVAEYAYDGNSNRLQQIDSSGETTITTTYTNDNAGMSQVLVSDDGATTTYNLFGLDLIQQDDGSETRTLLVDGLGSARVEIVGNTIENTTTYEPYGKLLTQSGSSGTVYGYTGEQYDAATSLVYLRARYYNPNLKVFMSRDPFPGYIFDSGSQNGYSYVGNNPINFIDPVGKWRWAKTGSYYHTVIENYYAGPGYGFDFKQLEYPNPLSYINSRIDMFNSFMGSVYEVEPITKAYHSHHGVNQAREYVEQLKYAARRGKLEGFYRGEYYNWNNVDFHLGTGWDWPGKLRTPMRGFPLVELVADYVSPGLIVYWLEPRPRVRLAVARANAPNRNLVRKRGYIPIQNGGLIPLPAPARVSTPIPERTIGTELATATTAGVVGYMIMQACNRLFTSSNSQAASTMLLLGGGRSNTDWLLR